MTGRVAIEAQVRGAMGEIVVRPCRGLEEIKACVALQKEVWNFSDADLIPVRLFVVAEKIGGQVIGGFQGRELVGFALALPGVHGSRIYLHSQMLAVRQQYRNGGLGQRLKLCQRDDALARGLDLMEWTFDPLEIKNSYLNIMRLGAIARRYICDQYGASSSPLQGGLPSDRLVAEWWLKSRRLKTLQDGIQPQFKIVRSISVPALVHLWKANGSTRGLARKIQEANREQFLQAFAEGLAVLGYERDPEGNGKFLLGAWDEDWSYPATKSLPHLSR
jgi:predicted GNAT superfamily acetyltransferase